MILIHNSFLLIIIFTTFLLLAVKNYSAMVKCFALQALLLSFMPILSRFEDFSEEVVILSLILLFVKVIIFPWLLLRTLKKTPLNIEKNSILNANKTLFLSLFLLVFSFWFSSRLPIKPPFTTLTMAVSVFTLTGGLLSLITRRSAFSHVIGYLIFENGIFLLAMTLARGIPFMIELGVLFDIFAGLIIMTVAIGHIGREFSNLDHQYMNQLKG